MISKRKLFILTFAVCAVSLSFAQIQPKILGKYEDIGTNLNEFAKHNAGRLNLTSSMGGNWSDAYIGELINFPPHFGFGLTLALNGIRQEQLNNLLVDSLNIKKIDPLFTEKVFFATYLLEMRIGGFRNIPFDVGLKVGFLPTMVPLPIFGDLAYSNFQVGGDIRLNLIKTFTGFKLSTAVAINYLDGYFEHTGYAARWSDTGGTGGTGSVLNPAGDTFRLFWNNLSFNLQLIFQKSFRSAGITLFGAVAAGYGLTNTGVAFLGENFTYNGSKVFDMTGKVMQDTAKEIEGKIGNDSKWTTSTMSGQFSLSGKIPVNTVDLHCYQGIAFDFDNDMHLQAAFSFDIWSLEYGISIGFRWQQQSN